jgi:hypothetical protein
MDLRNLSHEDLIEYCKEKQINYMTKLKKPMAKRTIITLLTKLPDIKITKKLPIITDDKLKEEELEKITKKLPIITDDKLEKNTKKLPIITDDKIRELNKLKEEELEKITKKTQSSFKNDIPTIGDLFELIKSNANNSDIINDENGITFITNENKNKKIKQINNNIITTGANIYISIVNNNSKISIKYYEGRCYYSNTMLLCKLKENNEINIKYIYYYLIYKKKYIEETYQKGLTNKTLDIHIFNFMQIHIPSLQIQNEIIKDIDDLNTIIESKKILLKNLNYETEIYIKYLNKNYENKNINELCEFLPRSCLNITDCETEGTYPFFNNPNKLDSYTFKNEHNIESIIIIKQTIYYAIEFSAAENCVIIQNKNIEDINLKYIYNYLRLINFTNINDVKIPLPSIKKQNDISLELEKYIENRNNLLRILETNINENKNIKRNIFIL